jgi:hypothetical protein
MSMILMIDGLAKRYGLLPSEVLNKCSTLDLYIMDAAMSFENFHHKKAMNNGKDPTPDYSEDELMKLLHKNRNQ